MMLLLVEILPVLQNGPFHLPLLKEVAALFLVTYKIVMGIEIL